MALYGSWSQISIVIDTVDKTSKNTEITLSKPPKEPWGMLAAAFASSLLMGVGWILVPMYYAQLVEYFDVPTARVAWIGSFQYTTLMYSGKATVTSSL